MLTSALMKHLLSYLLRLLHVSKRKRHHCNHNRRRGKEHHTRSRPQERKQRHQHHIYVCNAVTTSVLYNTTTTTTGAHPVTSKTTSDKNTFWPLAFTSTTSTSRMDSATCSFYHNHVYQHIQSSMVQHLPFLSGFVNFELTST